MIVVADTTPLNYLILTALTQILPELFGQIVVTQTVLRELQAPQAPEQVRDWIIHRPAWLIVKDVQREDVTLAYLDPGERETILLAQDLRADLILLDERSGRQEALRRGFHVVGTIGLLDRAAARGLIDLPTAIASLRQTNFRVSPRLLNK
jgi:predicted nucleic acid-binding protein